MGSSPRRANLLDPSPRQHPVLSQQLPQLDAGLIVGVSTSSPGCRLGPALLIGNCQRLLIGKAIRLEVGRYRHIPDVCKEQAWKALVLPVNPKTSGAERLHLDRSCDKSAAAQVNIEIRDEINTTIPLGPRNLKAIAEELSNQQISPNQLDLLRVHRVKRLMAWRARCHRGYAQCGSMDGFNRRRNWVDY